MSEKNKSSQVPIVAIGLLMGIIILIGVAVWLLTNRNETYTTSTSDESNYSALECTSSHPDDPFFVSETAQRYTHSLKALFTDDTLNEMSYRYEGTYDSNEGAKHAEAWMHGDYNQYMVAGGLNEESLNPVFSIDKSKVIISLYAEKKKINNTVARLFFINDEEYVKIGKYTPDNYRKMYEARGFTCKVSD